jgi:hypothetical protein
MITYFAESRLGPDTGDLAMRFGLHSGSVTAGVLRGDRARFQVRVLQNSYRPHDFDKRKYSLSNLLLCSFLGIP